MNRAALFVAFALIVTGASSGVARAVVAEPTPEEQCNAKGKCQATGNGGIVQGHYAWKDGACSCKADSSTDTGSKESTPVNQSTDDIKKQAQNEASQVNTPSNTSQSQNGAPNDYSGVQGQNGSPSGNAIADPKSNTGYGEMMSGQRGDQLFQQLGREAAARGEPGIGYTNTSGNGSISNGQVVFYGDANDVAALNDLAQNGDSYNADYFKPVDCWACNDPRFQGGQASTDFLRDNISSGNVMEPERFRLTTDGIDYLVSAAEARQFVSAFTELSTFGPSWSAAQSFGTWSGDFSYRPPASPFGMNSASFSNGLGGVMTNGLGSANCTSGVCVVSGQGGVVQPLGSGLAQPTPPGNLTPEQQSAWLKAFDQASASCGTDMLCRMAAQQTATQAIQIGTTNSDALASYMGNTANPVKAAFTEVTNAAKAAWNGFTQGLQDSFGSETVTPPSDTAISGASGQDSLLGGFDSGSPANSYVARSSTFGWGQGSGDSATQELKYAPGTLADNPYTIASNNPAEAGQRYAVTNPANGETVIAQVNDSGPFVKDENGNFVPHPTRQYDVSRQVATEIGMGYGVKDLVYTPVPADTPLGKTIEPYYNASPETLKPYADFSTARPLEGLSYEPSFVERSQWDATAPAVSVPGANEYRAEGDYTSPVQTSQISFEVVRPSSLPVDSVAATDFGGTSLQDIGPQDVVRPGGFTATSLTALTDLPNSTSVSPLGMGAESAQEATPSFASYAQSAPEQVLTATPPTSLALFEARDFGSTPASDVSVSPVPAPTATVVAEDDVEFNEQYFNMSGRRTDSDPGGDSSTLDVANPRQTPLGPQPVGNVGQAVPDARPQYANRSDTPTASRWVFYASNPLGAPGGDSFYAPNPTPQLGGGPLVQGGSWTDLPSNGPSASPFIQREGNVSFPREVSLTTPGAQYETGLNAPATNFQQTGSLQPSVSPSADAASNVQNPVMGSSANTEYRPTGTPDPSTIPVVDEAAASKELADFQAKQDAAPDQPKASDEPKSFTEKLSQYFSDVNQKIKDTASGFGISIAGRADEATGDTEPVAADDSAGGGVRGISVAPPTGAPDAADSRSLTDQGPQGYFARPETGTGAPADGGAAQQTAANGEATGPATTNPVPPVPGTDSAGKKYVDDPNAAIPDGTKAAQMPQDVTADGSKTIAGFDAPGAGAAKTTDATPPGAGPGATGPRAATGDGTPSGGVGGTRGANPSAGGSGMSGALGLLNSVLGLAKSAMGGGQGSGGSSNAAPTTPVQANPQTVLATPVPSTQFAQQKPLTDAPQISVVANPNPTDADTTSTISWRAQWAAAQNASTTRECAVADVAGKLLVEHGAESGSIETPALQHGAYYLIGCKQSDGKLGSTKILVSVKGDTQPPAAPPSLSAAPSTSDAAADLQNALYGAAPATSAAPATVADNQPQPRNVACDPNSSQYFSCLTGKMEFVDKLY